MAHLDNIDLEKTLSKNRLSFKSPWLELADNFLFYFKAAAFNFLIILTATFVEVKNNNDKAIVYFIFPTLLILTFYLCIRKALEKKLIPIDTSFSKDINRRLLVKYAKSEGWKIDFNNSNYLRARTGMDLGNWGYQITFIYLNNKVLLNVVRDNPIVRIPVFFRQNSLKKEIIRYLNSMSETVSMPQV